MGTQWGKAMSADGIQPGITTLNQHQKSNNLYVASTSVLRPLLLAQRIANAMHEPTIMLDRDSKILFANTCFYDTFKINADDTNNWGLFALDNAALNIPGLRTLLKNAWAEPIAPDGIQVTHEFPRIGSRTFLLHAGKCLGEDGTAGMMLLTFEDVSAQRAADLELALLRAKTDDLLVQKEVLLAEMKHRIVNSLQIIASILMLKARGVASLETRQHLHDAHRRVMSVAAVQQHLHSAGATDLIEIGPYLEKLCASLGESMVDDSTPAMLQIQADSGTILSSDAVGLGLIVTELVINALKYAFPIHRDDANVMIRYEVSGTAWRLSVTDNGVGRLQEVDAPVKGGLGTSLVKALANQLDATMEVQSSTSGLKVLVTHSTFVSRYALAD